MEEGESELWAFNWGWGVNSRGQCPGCLRSVDEVWRAPAAAAATTETGLSAVVILGSASGGRSLVSCAFELL
jgi:hypothetical protein